MKKIAMIGIFVCLIITLLSCGNNKKDLVNMTTLDNCKYQAIIWNDRTYVPYCAVFNDERGEQIGIVNGDENNQVYQYKDYPVEEWIISFYYSGEMDGSILMRELNVTEIPEEIESEYEWNK